MNKFIQLFKENKEIIILIPTLLGGLYQVLNLLILVGLPYIRYFSVSQVIPDGLLVSIVLFWLFVAYKIVMSLYKSISKDSEMQNNDEIRRKNSIFFHVFYILFFCSFGGYWFYTLYKEDDLTSFGLILIRYVTCIMSLLFIWVGIKEFLFITQLDKWIISKKNKLSYDTKKLILSIFVMSTLAIMVRIIPNEIAVINTMFIKVSNFENYLPFSQEIQTAYQMKSPPILLYINKDYAFFKIPDKQERILVVDAKSLTEIKKKSKDSTFNSIDISFIEQ